MPKTLSDCAKLPAPLRLLTFVIGLALLWLPFVALVYGFVSDPNLATILTMAIAFGLFLLWGWHWGRQVHRHPLIFCHYGLSLTKRNGQEFGIGILIGGGSLLALMLLQGGLGWVTWKIPDPMNLHLWLEGLAVGLGVGLAEELLFRGLLLDELLRDYSRSTSLWISSVIFAVLHFIKPLPEMIRTLPAFPGLLLLGLTLVWAKWSTERDHGRSPQGRLGLPIGFHAGLVWCSYGLHIGHWISYSEEIPQWITGIDQNPLAGLSGIATLGAIALCFRQRAQRSPALDGLD